MLFKKSFSLASLLIKFLIFLSRLGLHLPHPVDSESCSAKWDSKECNLIVTMSMKRELDYINF